MTRGARPGAAAVLETGWWWGAAAGIWLLTLPSVTWPELAAALACGLPCGLAARAGRHAMRARWQPAARVVPVAAAAGRGSR
jgi:hypothetical protein